MSGTGVRCSAAPARAAFVDRLGGVHERFPWAVGRAFGAALAGIERIALPRPEALARS